VAALVRIDGSEKGNNGVDDSSPGKNNSNSSGAVGGEKTYLQDKGQHEGFVTERKRWPLQSDKWLYDFWDGCVRGDKESATY